MDGYDVQKWEYAKEKAAASGFRLGHKGQAIALYRNEHFFCAFETASDAFQWLCGYEYGTGNGGTPMEGEK